MEDKRKKELEKHLDAIVELLTKEELLIAAITTYYCSLDVGDLIDAISNVLVDDSKANHFGC